MIQFFLMHRWDINAMDSLPPYMRPFYQAILDIFDELEEELTKEGKSDRVYYGKFEVILANFASLFD